MVHITSVDKCCICRREIPLEKEQDTKVSHNVRRGIGPYGGWYLHKVCYSSMDHWELTEKARSVLSAPDHSLLQTID